jgi:hypothetical protein
MKGRDLLAGVATILAGLDPSQDFARGGCTPFSRSDLPEKVKERWLIYASYGRLYP